MVARLAIMRAGGAYFSGFAADPSAYLDSVVQRTGPKVLMKTPNFKENLKHHVKKVITVTPEFLRELPTYNTPLLTSVQPDDACLIIFTSGSTGKTKDIIQTHRAYSPAIISYARNFGLGPHTRFLCLDHYAFDISNIEFLAPLVIGSCYCILGSTGCFQDIADHITNLQANIMFMTATSAMRLDPASVRTLDILCVCGEPMPKDLIRKWAGSKIKLTNRYGMGEMAVYCASNFAPDPSRNDNVGRPGPGAIWVVDLASPDRPIPIGAVGELLMEGHHMPRGYLDQTSRKTEVAFLDQVPSWMHKLHPERSSTTRLYRSGDLGRLNHEPHQA